jgi:photosystem II stability/assembly factor-like uncharacterized protein
MGGRREQCGEQRGDARRQTYQAPHGLKDIFFVDTSIIYLTHSDGEILKSTNQGETWNLSYDVGQSLNAIKFVNIETGYACGKNGIFVKNTI